MRTPLALFISIAFTFQVHASDPAKVQDIRKFFKLTNVAELSFAGIKSNAELQRQANPQIPTEFWTELLKELKPEEFIDRMIPIYDKHFSHEEIKAWITFFETPAGQAFFINQRLVLQESAVVGQAYVQEIGGPILKRLRNKK